MLDKRSRVTLCGSIPVARLPNAKRQRGGTKPSFAASALSKRMSTGTSDICKTLSSDTLTCVPLLCMFTGVQPLLLAISADAITAPFHGHQIVIQSGCAATAHFIQLAHNGRKSRARSPRHSIDTKS